jgi:hypothetical protein
MTSDSLGYSSYSSVEFVGGPWDGAIQPIHPAQNAAYLTISGHPEGHYTMFPVWLGGIIDGKYHWVPEPAPC